mgnify:CR=1 FL=1
MKRDVAFFSHLLLYLDAVTANVGSDKCISVKANSVFLVIGKQIQEKRLKVSVARPSSSAAKGGNLYCSNMDEYVTEQTMEELFCPYGKVVETKILKGECFCYSNLIFAVQSAR